MSDFLTIATDAINRGFSVIPLKARGKDPFPGWGATSRSRNVGSFAQVPTDCNVGICADENFIILESDDEARLRLLIRQMTGHELPITLMSGARHNRPHFFFKATEEALKAGNFQVTGLFECRFINSYVVGPGSLHPEGAVYRWLNDYAPVEFPSWLLNALQTLHGDIQTNKPINADLTGAFVYGEGERHYALTSLAGKVWDGSQDEEELFEILWKFNTEQCFPPRDVEHVKAIARHYVNRAEPNDPGPTVLMGGKPLQPFKIGPAKSLSLDKPTHIVPSKGRGFGEWFPRGEVSLICAPSGMGKTKLMLGLLENLRKGEPLFGREGVKADYRIFTADRSLQALRRSVMNCQLDAAAVMHRAHKLDILETEPRHKTMDRLLKGLEEIDQVPDVVFVDGMDIWVPKAAVSDLDVVVRFLQGLIEVARQWNVAVIGSVGSPKQKLKDRYTLTRDQVLGSIGWGRTVETIGFMSLMANDDDDSVRKVLWLPREGRSETYHFTFDDEGRFKETTIDSVSEPEGVAETREVKRDAQADMIAIIQGLPAGTELHPDMFPWVKRATAYNYFANLAHPSAGWVGKINGKWVVTKKEQ